ncbi:MAG: nucleotidyl transferase AbiEii/AbiGii toxin family protein [Acidobacteriota bacterium]
MKEVPFSVDSRWFKRSCNIHTYELDELLGTKLRALYQRKWGRDLFDLAIALKAPQVDPARIVAAFLKYMEHEGHTITRAQFEENLALKMRNEAFLADIGPLLATGYQWDPDAAALVISSRLIEILPGEPWKGETR